MTSSKWMMPPPMWRANPNSQNTNITTMIAQMIPTMNSSRF